MKVVAFIAAGGALGTVARYALQGWVQLRVGGFSFPLGTLVVNIAGSLVLGFVMRFAMGSTGVSPDLRAGITIGFCGAFTTMSTFSYEAVSLVRDTQYGLAALYIGGTLIGSIGALLAGAALAGRLL
jgi:CrcB protein